MSFLCARIISNLFHYIGDFFSSAKMSKPVTKKNKDDTNKEAYSIDVAEDAKSYLEKILGDVKKSSATKQIILGSTTGWYYIFHILYLYLNIYAVLLIVFKI